MAADGLNALIARINSADSQIDQARGQITAACGTLDGLFVSNVWTEVLDLPDLDPSVAEMAKGISQAATGVAGELVAALDQGAQTLQEHDAELNSLMNTWDTALQRALEQAQSFEQSLQDALERIGDSYDELGTRLEAAGQALDQAETAFDKAYADWEQATSGEFASKLEQRFTAMVDDLAQAQTQQIEQHLADAQTQSGDAIEQLLSTGSQLINELSHSIGDAIEQLRQHVGDDIATKLDETGQAIIETAIKEIMQSILESIATSQLGVEVTAAMAPILPELIAIKKISDAILAAIQLWKETLGRLSDPFDVF